MLLEDSSRSASGQQPLSPLSVASTRRKPTAVSSAVSSLQDDEDEYEDEGSMESKHGSTCGSDDSKQQERSGSEGGDLEDADPAPELTASKVLEPRRRRQQESEEGGGKEPTPVTLPSTTNYS